VVELTLGIFGIIFSKNSVISLLARFGLHPLNLQKEIKEFKPETAKKMAKQNMIQEMLFDVN
jgi:hypothetical protein